MRRWITSRTGSARITKRSRISSRSRALYGVFRGRGRTTRSSLTTMQRHTTRFGETAGSPPSSTGTSPLRRHARTTSHTLHSAGCHSTRSVVESEGFTAFDSRPARLRRFLDRYGWEGDSAEFIRIVQRRLRSLGEEWRELAGSGDPDAARLV